MSRRLPFLFLWLPSLALVLLSTLSAEATFANAFPPNSSFPPQWTKNKTEWKIRLYNSLRLTPWQVELLEVVLDSRDLAKAPLTAAADAVALAVSNATLSMKKADYNSSFEKNVVRPIEQIKNATVYAIEGARVSLLNKTEIALRSGVAAIEDAAVSVANGSSPPFFFHPLAATPAAALLARKLNVSANVVAKRIATLTTIEQYRVAAAIAKATATGAASAPLGDVVFVQYPSPISTSSAVVVGASAAVGDVEQPERTPMGPDRIESVGAPAPLTELPPRLEKHPSWLVHESDDDDIAEWISAKPKALQDYSSSADPLHVLKLANWIRSVPKALLNDIAASGDEQRSWKSEESDFIGITPADIIEPPKLRASVFSTIPREMTPEEAAEDAKVEAAAMTLPVEEGSSSARPPQINNAFYRKIFDNGTMYRTVPVEQGFPEAGPAIASYPASQLTALDLQAMPSIQPYYTYLALRAIGVRKSLAAATAVATQGLGFDAAVAYVLSSEKIRLSQDAVPVWGGQAATPYIVPDVGIEYPVVPPAGSTTGKKRRSLASSSSGELSVTGYPTTKGAPSAFTAAAAPPPPPPQKVLSIPVTPREAPTADFAAPARAAVAVDPKPSSSIFAALRRRLANFGTNTR